MRGIKLRCLIFLFQSVAFDKITGLVVSEKTEDAIYFDFTEAFDVPCFETTKN